jgi:hypothetical protein
MWAFTPLGLHMKMKIESFLAAVKIGVDFGPKPFKVGFQSSNARFALVSRSGYTGWMGVGHQGYYPAKHSLIDLSKAQPGQRGITLWNATCVREWNGRFTAENRREMERAAK